MMQEEVYYFVTGGLIIVAVNIFIVSYFHRKHSITETRLNELAIDVLNLAKQFETSKKLDSLIAEVEKLKEFKGSANEKLLRDTVARLHGGNYCRGFVVQGLSGLARLVEDGKKTFRPKDYKQSPTADENSSDFQKQQHCTQLFVDHIKNSGAGRRVLELFLEQEFNLKVNNVLHLDEMSHLSIESLGNDSKSAEELRRTDIIRKFLSGTLKKDFDREASEKQRPMYDKFIEYALKTKGEQDAIVKSDVGIGLILFCASFRNPIIDNHFPIHELELDCRGNIESWSTDSGGTEYLVVIGEIKSSYNSDACDQLARSLSVIGEALKLYSSPVPKVTRSSAANAVVVKMKGQVFVPVKTRGLSKKTECKKFKGIQIEAVYV